MRRCTSAPPRPRRATTSPTRCTTARSAERIAAIVAGEPVNLLETLAQRIADVLLAYDGVRMVAVTVHKPHAPIDLQFADVSVTIRRAQRGSSPSLQPC